jgi:formate hydrogenlyase subunit 5
VEGPRGELVYAVYPGGDAGPPWVRLRPASAANWPALPLAVAAGNVLQDVPIIEASFALSVSALDR